MMQCRMCSQRLTRPGKLCRECERELGRARAAAASADTLSGAVPLIDASRMAGAPPVEAWRARLRSRPALLVTAFSIGLATAAAGYVVQRTQSAPADASVMLDRDVRNIKPRSFGASTTAQVANFQPIESPSAAVPERPENARRAPAPESPARHASAARPTRVATGVATATASTSNAQGMAADPERSNPALMPVAAAGPGSVSDGLDRVLALSTALESCAQEPLFSRIACEYRARLKLCAGVAGRIAQCGGNDGPVDHGQ
jgi:hypothetical protein